MNLPGIKHRLISAALILSALYAAFRWLPDAFVPFALAALAIVMSMEFYQMMSAAGVSNFNRYGTAGNVLLVFVTWYASIHRGGVEESWDSIILFLVTIGIFLRQFPQKNNPHPLRTIGGTLFGVLYIGLLWNFLTKLMLFQRPENFVGIYMPGRWLLLYGVFAAKFTDVGAYLVGCSIGRHKLIPRISPGKSWEGVFGGILVGTLAGTALVWSLQDIFVPLGLTPFRAIPLGIVLSICAITGDLTESLFKRAANVKDSGGFIPGMGGILDVLDSLLFTFPAVYLFLRLVA